MSTTPPKCSCIVCKKECSIKGIHTHYVIAHTEKGKQTHLLNSRNGAALGGDAYAATCKNKRALLESKYLINPGTCQFCNSKLTYDMRENKFCSQSCAAKFNMAERIKSGWTQSDETRLLRSTTMKNKPHNPPKTKISFCKCEICNSNFVWNQITSVSKRFCSAKCLSTHRSNKARSNPGLGTKRSKDEIILYELCKSHFNHVMPNEKLIDGWDADIAIYDTRTAILWNGPWHYRDMKMKNHSLLQVQNRDNIKTKLFVDAGWQVIVFEDRYFTPQTAFNTLIGGTGGI